MKESSFRRNKKQVNKLYKNEKNKIQKTKKLFNTVEKKQCNPNEFYVYIEK